MGSSAERGFLSTRSVRVDARSASGIRSLQVDLAPSPFPAQLEPEWRALEAASAGPSFFLTWPWIGTWLSRLPADVRPCLLRARHEGRTVGLAIVCEGERRRGPITTPALFLHATGRRELDDLTVEYNGVLAARGVEAAVLQAMATALSHEPAWEEVYLDGWHHADLLPHLAMPDTRCLVARRRPYRFVDLAGLRARGCSYVDLVDGKTRNLVRRTLRESAKLGHVAFTVARDTEEALAFLAHLERLSDATWKARGKPCAFDNPRFGAFHRELVGRHFDGGHLQLGRLAAGDRPIGYVYNFVHAGRVYVYQTGFDYTVAPFAAWSLGLTTHACAIEHNRALGHDTYDFMAGDSSYKRDLATGHGEMDWVILQRPRLTLRMSLRAREIWLKMRRLRRGMRRVGPV